MSAHSLLRTASAEALQALNGLRSGELDHTRGALAWGGDLVYSDDMKKMYRPIHFRHQNEHTRFIIKGCFTVESICCDADEPYTGIMWPGPDGDLRTVENLTAEEAKESFLVLSALNRTVYRPHAVSSN